MGDFEINGSALKKYLGQDKVVVVPEGITKIGQNAFCRNEFIEKVVLPFTVVDIMKSAFSGCSNLKEINIPNGLEFLGMHALDGCYNLEKLYIPKSVTLLYASSFSQKVELTIEQGSIYSIRDNCVVQGDKLIKYIGKDENEFVVPEYIKVVGTAAFRKNDSVEKLIVPKTVLELESSAFTMCDNLKTCELQGELKDIPDECFSWCKELKNIIFPSGVENIGKNAFYSCEKLEIQQFPSTIKKVEEDAFYGYSGKPFLDEKSGAWEKIKQGKKTSISKTTTSKPSTARIKQDQICEYADNLAKQFNIERVNVEELGLDMWHKVIIESEGLFSIKDNLINIAVSNEVLKVDDWQEQRRLRNRPLTIESAKRLGKMQLKKAMDEYCKGVALNYQGDAKKDVEKILFKNTEPKWGRIYATSYRELPIEMMGPSGKISDNAPPKIEDGKLVVEVDKKDSSISHYYLSEAELPKNGNIIVPLRLRIVSDCIPTEDNMHGTKWDSMKREDVPIPVNEDYICESCEHNYKNYYYFDFYIDDVKHEFCIMLTGYSGTASILEYKVGKDDEGYYIDALFKMKVSKFVYY